MLLYIVQIPLFTVAINKRYKGLKLAYLSKDKDYFYTELLLSFLTVLLIIFLTYISILQHNNK